MSKKAIELLEEAKQNNMSLDAFIYTAVIDGKKETSLLQSFRINKSHRIVLVKTACAKARMWRDALELLDDMQENNVLPNEYTYSAVITACGNGGQWNRALELLDQVGKEIKLSLHFLSCSHYSKVLPVDERTGYEN